eukprot:g82710.t1
MPTRRDPEDCDHEWVEGEYRGIQYGYSYQRCGYCLSYDNDSIADLEGFSGIRELIKLGTFPPNELEGA